MDSPLIVMVTCMKKLVIVAKNKYFAKIKIIIFCCKILQNIYINQDNFFMNQNFGYFKPGVIIACLLHNLFKLMFENHVGIVGSKVKISTSTSGQQKFASPASKPV